MIVSSLVNVKFCRNQVKKATKLLFSLQQCTKAAHGTALHRTIPGTQPCFGCSAQIKDGSSKLQKRSHENRKFTLCLSSCLLGKAKLNSSESQSILRF